MMHDSEKGNSENETLEELKSLEHKLLLLNLNSEESFVIVDKNYQVYAFSMQFANLYLKYFGIEVKHGISILDLVLPERREMLKDIYQQTFNGAFNETELNLELENKEIIIIRSRFKPAIDADGKVLGAYVSADDISLFKRTEQERNQALIKIEFDNLNFRALIDNSSDMIWSHNLSFRMIAFNQAFKDYVMSMTGNSIEIGDNVLDFFTDQNRREKFENHCIRTLKGESFTVLDHYFVPEEIWREVSFNPIYDSGIDGYSGIACISRDITERKLSERKLHLSRKRLKQAQKLAHIGNWNIETKAKVVNLSDEAGRIFGVKSSEGITSIQELFRNVHEDDKLRVRQSIEIAMELNEDFQLYCRLIHSENKIIHVYIECVFEKGSSEKLSGLYGIVQDVTERVQKEQELQKLLIVTQKQNEWLNSFTHIVSHNIRSNNNNIKSLTELLDESNDYDETQHIMKMLRTSTDKLDETIHNLSEFLKFQNQENINYAHLCLKDEIDKTLSAVNQLLLDAEAQIINEVDQNVHIFAVPSFIESILLNLLTNAIKYRSEERPVLKFNCNKNEAYTELCVEDNGIGIDLLKHKDSVFGLFKTFHHNKDAVGFGLFMTKNQMEMMNGKIDIQSEPGLGTTIKLYFNEKN